MTPEEIATARKGVNVRGRNGELYWGKGRHL